MTSVSVFRSLNIIEPSIASSKEEEISLVEEKEFIDCSKFEQLYLIGEILGETLL